MDALQEVAVSGESWRRKSMNLACMWIGSDEAGTGNLYHFYYFFTDVHFVFCFALL